MQDFFSIDIRWKDVAAILNMSIMVSFIDIFEALYWHQMLTKSDDKNVSKPQGTSSFLQSLLCLATYKKKSFQ
jgi:hypothetical protein